MHIVAIAHKAAERLLQQQQQQQQQQPSPSASACNGGASKDDSSIEARWIHKPKGVAAVLPSRERHPPAGVLSKYQEMHVHGPVVLARHVARLVVSSSRYKDDATVISRLKAFSEKHGVPVVWMDEGQ